MNGDRLLGFEVFDLDFIRGDDGHRSSGKLKRSKDDFLGDDFVSIRSLVATDADLVILGHVGNLRGLGIGKPY